MLVLFNPTALLRIQAPLFAPLRHAMYVLPLMLLAAINLAARNAELMQQDLKKLLDGFNLVEHWIISLVFVNLMVTWLTALLAHRYRATVTGFGIALVMRFYPRFALRMGHLDQLSRVERMWLHGAPLMLRLFIFCIGLYVWFTSHSQSEHVPAIALAISTTAAASLFFSANPLFKSNGYYLLAAFINEPHLRGKAFKALLNKFRGGTFKEANELLLATYAITMAAFMFILVVGAASFVGFALHQLYLGGSSIIVACVVGFILLRRVILYFGKVESAYERSLQFDRWRKRSLGDEEDKDAPTKGGGFASYVWKAALLIGFVALFLPYSYNAGGPFVVHPKLQQPITTDVSGRIEAVFYDGGETVPKGAVVARLASTEEQAQAAVLEKKMAEQRAWIDHLKSLPRPEEVELARMQLHVEETRVKFSRIQLDRIKSLVDQNFAPREELDNARRQLDVDKREVAEKRAALEVAKMGKTQYEIAAAEANYEALKAERDTHLDRIRRADLIMPFDGVLLTQYLEEKGNSYYKSGDVFADAESSGFMTAEIEVPESEAEYLAVGSTVEFKAMSYSDEVFTGTVVQIDTDVTERTFGNVIKVIAAIDDADGRLKNGMTGYAKTEGPTLPVWEAFSRQVFRFVQVHVWSWIP
jgi:putative peptide zinc metalloprotease protein